MSENPNLPQPDPELRRLDRFVGRWSMEGHLVGSDETNIRGETAFRWLPGGFFLEQHVQLDFMGMQIDSLELIGYDPRPRRFPRPSTPTCPPRRCHTSGASRQTT
jgi:hypothetical protein